MSDLLTAQVVVTTGGVKVVGAIPQGQSVLITNRDATNSIFAGSSTETTTTGAEIKPGTSWANAFVDLPPETEVWLKCSAGTPRADISQIIAD
jgi:hypothetical protein